MSDLLKAIKYYETSNHKNIHISGSKIINILDLLKESEEQQKQIAKLENDIQQMIHKAAQNHRPAYDEQQRKIMKLEKVVEAAKASLQYTGGKGKGDIAKALAELGEQNECHNY